MSPGGSQSVADVVHSVLGDPTFRDNARKVAAQIGALPSPADVASQLAAALSHADGGDQAVSASRR